MKPSPAETAPRRSPPFRLAFRLALVLSLGAAVISLAAAAWNLALQRRQLTRLVEEQAATVVSVIRSASRDAMLRNDSAELSRIVDALADRESVDRIRVFDKPVRINPSCGTSSSGKANDTASAPR